MSGTEIVRKGGYQGDDQLARLLAEAGVALCVEDVKDIARGVAAAGLHDSGSWTVLVCPKPHPGLERQLQALRELLAEEMDDGLGNSNSLARLEALRRELERRRLQGLIIPQTDEHQGECIPRQAERLAWLTGFTGSAGMAIVLPKKAVLFVDGRYILQASAEVDGDSFAIVHQTGAPPRDWLVANIMPAAALRLGYDPWLHTPADAARFKAVFAKFGAEFVALGDNPIDAVWVGRFPPPLSPVLAHPRNFAGKNSDSKRSELARALRKDRLDAVVLTALDSIAWLLNIRGKDVPFSPLARGFAILRSNASVQLFMDARKIPDATCTHLGKEVSVQAPEDFGPALDQLGVEYARVLVDQESSPAWVHNRLKQAGAKIEKGPDPCLIPKARKNPGELNGIRDAHRRDGVALVRFLAWLSRKAAKGELTELAAVEKLARLRSQGEHYQGPSFPTISGAGPNGAIVHYRASEATNRKLTPGDLYLVDSGGQYLDGTTDVTRTIAIGEPNTETRDRFTRVLKGHIAIAAAHFPEGTCGFQLDALARLPLWKAGLDYDHGTGHGVGCYLNVHEGPQCISKRFADVPLEPGMVLSNEPGYYKAGAYGVRIENLMVVKAARKAGDGGRSMLYFETLTLAPIDRSLIKVKLMTQDEIAWLDAYHERVRGALAPLLGLRAARWLEAATRPIG